MFKCRCARSFRDVAYLRRHEAKCKVVKERDKRVFTAISGGPHMLFHGSQWQSKMRKKVASAQPQQDLPASNSSLTQEISTSMSMDCGSLSNIDDISMANPLVIRTIQRLRIFKLIVWQHLFFLLDGLLS
ncbi:hypothetical protein CPB84DRAFT_1824960 [Gymnopilus junonius]|uniref:Uncharacterized protein n=1 Tax=Gymnopilus junonius TaxID=109634 RepID=A0A9P5NMY1_GYMJU|nr:hypothetical protein CPB84DRAFT_1824960 [Gymnopilus junonius]